MITTYSGGNNAFFSDAFLDAGGYNVSASSATSTEVVLVQATTGQRTTITGAGLVFDGSGVLVEAGTITGIAFQDSGLLTLPNSRSGTSNNWLSGDADNDTMNGGLGVDDMDGGKGRDIMYGNDGDDIVKGGSGKDQLWGGSGVDTHTGGISKDILRGKKGKTGLTAALAIQSGSDVLFDMGGGDTLTLLNTNLVDVNVSDIVIA